MAGSGIAEILLVEDDPRDAEMTLHALKRCGLAHRVEHVTDGASALDYVASMAQCPKSQPANLPRVILLDLRLHKMGGLHVLRQLKMDERTKSIPVIALTSSKMAIEIVESYKLGVNSYVIKPSDPSQFEEVVSAIGHYWLAINEPPIP
jgi:two-component system, response regulator